MVVLLTPQDAPPISSILTDKLSLHAGFMRTPLTSLYTLTGCLFTEDNLLFTSYLPAQICYLPNCLISKVRVNKTIYHTHTVLIYNTRIKGTSAFPSELWSILDNRPQKCHSPRRKSWFGYALCWISKRVEIHEGTAWHVWVIKW